MSFKRGQNKAGQANKTHLYLVNLIIICFPCKGNGRQAHLVKPLSLLPELVRNFAELSDKTYLVLSESIKRSDDYMYLVLAYK